MAEAEVLAALALRRVGALVAITGPPASGKTALALRVVAALEEQLPATWIDVGGAWDPARAAGLSGALAAVSARGDGPALALAQRLAASGGAGLVILDALSSWRPGGLGGPRALAALQRACRAGRCPALVLAPSEWGGRVETSLAQAVDLRLELGGRGRVVVPGGGVRWLR